ncbi:dodecin family protein [Rhodosalinus sp.]|uniref:dodecin family protein n=1 Tax=Rhodosalinus sp. TaxID=2047741 RepID=UPI0039792E0F
MSIARVTEISATSPQSFDDAVKQGIEHASGSLRNIKSAWIKDSNVEVKDGKVSEYRVNMEVTFVLDE